MIAVVADDFTGAAEIAGIGLQHNLSVQVFTNGIKVVNADLIIVSTDSRSLSKADALAVTRKAVQELLSLKPELIYKKTDSVLRGYVVDELREQMVLQGFEKALLLPANPSLNRTIKNGNYYIDDVLIHETSFAIDPEFAILNPSITSMLSAELDSDISILKHTDTLTGKGIVVGEVSTKKDIDEWLQKVNSDYVLAGAGDCFETILHRLNYKQEEQNKFEFLYPCLYVSGTSYSKSVTLIKEIDKLSGCVHYLSQNILQQQDDEIWYQEVASSIERQQKAVIAINNPLTLSVVVSALEIRIAMAKATKKIIRQSGIIELLIEGGSTAAAILEALEIDQFVPVHQLARGVIRMKANDLFITVKPGSYEMPDIIKRLYNL